jgi:hypothetical protein
VPADSTYNLAFETIGNATLIAHDRSPVLATDPWLFGPAYFGSWILSHEIPEEQLASVHACRYIWISHGHPDHLSMPSLETLRDKTILLPDHVGGRIRAALEEAGFRVKVLPDRQWVPLSPRIRVLSIADVYQDAVLLVEMDGVLVIDANDSEDRGWGPTVRRAVRRNRTAFLLALSGFGDADMINYFDPDGNRIPPRRGRRIPPGWTINTKMAALGATRFIPFASMHRYQREDSLWANEYTTKLDEFAIGFDSSKGEILPAFVRYDCTTDTVARIDPPERVIEVQPASAFGDDWSEALAPEEHDLLTRYVQSVASLSDVVDSVTFRVGGADHEITLGGGTGRAVRFEAPRASLVSAARWEIFDDLLIGNFVKTTLFGDWPLRSLRPDFTSRLAKYADNGGAHTRAEIRAYVAEYRRRAPLDYAQFEARRRYNRVVRRAARVVRRRVGEGSALQRAGSSLYDRALR